MAVIHSTAARNAIATLVVSRIDEGSANGVLQFQDDVGDEVATGGVIAQARIFDSEEKFSIAP